MCGLRKHLRKAEDIKMEIVPVMEENLRDAAFVHGAAWRVSHEDICSDDFIAAHTTERQMGYIRDAMNQGRRFYLLETDLPVAVVAVEDSVISDLYVHPAEQRKGYGTILLRYAIGQCEKEPTLWVLNTNEGARRLYQREGFSATGITKVLSDTLFEIEMLCMKGCSV